MGTYLPGAGTLGWVVCSGARILGSRGIPPNFYLPHVDVGPPVSIFVPLCATLPLLCLFMCLYVSAPPTHLDECDFFKSLVV